MLVVAVVCATPLFAQTRTKTHVQTLASDTFEGRLTGSPGEKLAADYLISELKRMGAKPLPGMTDFRMPFTFTAGSKDGGSTFNYTDSKLLGGVTGGTEVLARVFTRRALQAAFPGRQVVQVDALEIVEGGGGIHCVTQQEPAP